MFQKELYVVGENMRRYATKQAHQSNPKALRKHSHAHVPWGRGCIELSRSLTSTRGFLAPRTRHAAVAAAQGRLAASRD